jgi:predicted glycosyltransferase
MMMLPDNPAKIWIDLDNTPHVPFFIPIIRELERRGHRVFLTARDAYQVCDLARAKGLSCTKIGRHFGKRRILKVAGVLWRSSRLLKFCLRNKPNIALSHGSRSLNMIGNLLGITTVGLTDYEHSRSIPLSTPRWLIAASPLIAEGLAYRKGRLLSYRGIKEDVYVGEFRPDPALLSRLGLGEGEILVMVRPPAEEAHYHNPESDLLLVELMKRVAQAQGVRVVMLPRNRRQEERLREYHPTWFADDKTVVPPSAVDGLNLIWHSDLVVSGGGTMNREAAALGVPVYSIFRGKIGAVDRMLERDGRLTMIRYPKDVWTKIHLAKRKVAGAPGIREMPALEDIIDRIEEIIRIEPKLSAKQRPGR